jgi:hypothetical protein
VFILLCREHLGNRFGHIVRNAKLKTTAKATEVRDVKALIAQTAGHHTTPQKPKTLVTTMSRDEAGHAFEHLLMGGSFSVCKKSPEDKPFSVSDRETTLFHSCLNS